MQHRNINRISLINVEKNAELTELNDTNFNRIFKNLNRYYSPLEISQYTQKRLNAPQGDNLQLKTKYFNRRILVGSQFPIVYQLGPV